MSSITLYTTLHHNGASSSSVLYGTRKSRVSDRYSDTSLVPRLLMCGNVCNLPEILGNQKLFVLYSYNCDDITYTLPLHHPHVFWPTMEVFRSFVLLRSPATSSSLPRLGTSDMSLKKVQVATTYMTINHSLFLAALTASLMVDTKFTFSDTCSNIDRQSGGRSSFWWGKGREGEGGRRGGEEWREKR